MKRFALVVLLGVGAVSGLASTPERVIAAATPGWLVELRNAGGVPVCTGAVTYSDAAKFQIATAAHCFGGFTKATIGLSAKMWDLQQLKATRTTLGDTDFGIVDVPCSKATCPKSTIQIGTGEARLVVYAPNPGAAGTIDLVIPTLQETADFNRAHTGPLYRQCEVRLKAASPIVNGYSGAPVVTADEQTLVAVVSTESDASGVASFCGPVDPPSCDFTNPWCLGKLAEKGFGEPIVFKFTDLFFNQWLRFHKSPRS